MDELKLNAKADEGFLSIVKISSDDILNHNLVWTIMKRFSKDVGMQFGPDNCAKVTFRKGSLVKSKNTTLDIKTEIALLELNKTNMFIY